jgi:hypothetical protein
MRRKTLSLPPEPLLRSYLSLIHTVFVDLRSSERFGEVQKAYVYDLANAMHNIAFLIGEYDQGWLNDEKFRRMEIGDFDERWKGLGGILLAKVLDDALPRQRPDSLTQE